MDELVKRAKDGDNDAFEQLVKDNQRGVYTLALRYIGNHDDALDISQEAFLRAYRGLKFFQGDSSFSTWLYRLTVNASIDYLRKAKRRRAIPFSALGEPDQVIGIPDTKDSPEQTAELSELKNALNEALQMLKYEHRTVFILRCVHELSYTEIAEILNIEEGTVKSRLSRARDRLKEILKGNFSDSPPSKHSRKGGRAV
ncbi:MAG: sigma-70 family RNA polymerase sigma factor [Oscillospiraceae bacterium]|nr:sigma-70 family RNA polymerase sigma factor [Oscillospiraceae bacterium]